MEVAYYHFSFIANLFDSSVILWNIIFLLNCMGKLTLALFHLNLHSYCWISYITTTTIICCFFTLQPIHNCIINVAVKEHISMAISYFLQDGTTWHIFSRWDEWVCLAFCWSFWSTGWYYCIVFLSHALWYILFSSIQSLWYMNF